MTTTTAARPAWYVWNSGMGAEFCAVEILSIGAKGRYATCRTEGRTLRLRVGDLVMVNGSDETAAWEECYR